MVDTRQYENPGELRQVYPDDDAEAESRAGYFKTRDPFPEIQPALLSAEHIGDYARVAALIHPFYPTRDRLKPASYEAHATKFIRWDNEGKKLITVLHEGDKYILPANTITFVQIESKIRLPEYIALRFNLRIKHVHRGLLLGTGPLVDPTFWGDLLIPLHNLTSEDYEIDQGDGGIIWIEFTKTSRSQTINGTVKRSLVQSFFQLPSKKTDVSSEAYFERASNNNPIQSSIPRAVKDAQEKAAAAEVSAKRAVRTNRIYASIGILAIAGFVLAAANLAISLVHDTDTAGSEAQKATAEVQRLESRSMKLGFRNNGLAWSSVGA